MSTKLTRRKHEATIVTTTDNNHGIDSSSYRSNETYRQITIAGAYMYSGYTSGCLLGYTSFLIVMIDADLARNPALTLPLIQTQKSPVIIDAFKKYERAFYTEPFGN